MTDGLKDVANQALFGLVGAAVVVLLIFVLGLVRGAKRLG